VAKAYSECNTGRQFMTLDDVYKEADHGNQDGCQRLRYGRSEDPISERNEACEAVHAYGTEIFGLFREGNNLLSVCPGRARRPGDQSPSRIPGVTFKSIDVHDSDLIYACRAAHFRLPGTMPAQTVTYFTGVLIISLGPCKIWTTRQLNCRLSSWKRGLDSSTPLRTRKRDYRITQM
jgi:hypothetical protein